MSHERFNSWRGKFIRYFLSFFPKKEGAVIVTFHNIVKDKKTWFREILYFIREDYGFMSPGNLENYFEKGINSGKKVLLTFDDGFFSNRIIAETVLAELGIKAIFFVSNDFIGLSLLEAVRFAEKNLIPNSQIDRKNISDYASMSWDDVKWIKSQGHEIGAHTLTHRKLSVLSLPEKKAELIGSSESLTNKIGDKIRFFAFPFGTTKAIDLESMEIATGRYNFIFSNIRGGVDESPGPHFIFRQNIVPGDPLWLVKAIIDGRMDWRFRAWRKEAHSIFSNLD